MKKLLLSFSLLSTITFAGHDTGSGGGVHLCPGRTPEARFYDLYEGKYGRGDTPIPVFEEARGTKDEMLEAAFKKLIE